MQHRAASLRRLELRGLKSTAALQTLLRGSDAVSSGAHTLVLGSMAG